MSQTKQGNQIKLTKLTSTEREVVEGSLLGDGTLSSSGENYRLRVEHASKHYDYLKWKYDLIQRLCISDIQYVKQHSSMRFGTIGHPELTQLRHKWYHPNKQIPSNLVLTDLMIAIWFMDDGTKHRDTVNFSVHNFSSENIEFLQKQLANKQIYSSINSDAKGKRLYILKESYNRFKKLVKPYIIECMAYKLP